MILICNPTGFWGEVHLRKIAHPCWRGSKVGQVQKKKLHNWLKINKDLEELPYMNDLMVSWLHSSSSSLHCSLVIKSYPTLGTLWLVAHQASLSMGFSKQESWSGFPFPSPGDLFHPGIEPKCPELQVDSLPTGLQGNPPHYRWHAHHFPLDVHLCLASLLTKQNCFSLCSPSSCCCAVSLIMNFVPAFIVWPLWEMHFFFFLRNAFFTGDKDPGKHSFYPVALAALVVRFPGFHPGWKWKWRWVAQSCPTFCDPLPVAYQASPSMGFSRQKYWSGLPFPSPGDLPDPGIEPGSPTL